MAYWRASAVAISFLVLGLFVGSESLPMVCVVHVSIAACVIGIAFLRSFLRD